MNKKELIIWLEGFESAISTMEDISIQNALDIVGEIITHVELELNVEEEFNKDLGPKSYNDIIKDAALQPPWFSQNNWRIGALPNWDFEVIYDGHRKISTV